MTPAEVAAALSAAAPASAAGGWRSTDRADGVTVVNDAYNANPDSMRAALARARPRLPAAARRIAVLGPWRSWGRTRDAEHDAAGPRAAAAGVDLLVVVGPER